MELGDKLPDIELPDHTGHERPLEEIVKNKIAIIFFYPKDDTPGCTREACAFRDNYQQILDAGAEVIGISKDSIKSHQDFRDNHHLPFPLLSDKNGRARKAFGVKGLLFGILPGRETFIFDRHGILRFHYKSQTNAYQHVQESLKAVKELKKRN